MKYMNSSAMSLPLKLFLKLKTFSYLPTLIFLGVLQGTDNIFFRPWHTTGNRHVAPSIDFHSNVVILSSLQVAARYKIIMADSGEPVAKRPKNHLRSLHEKQQQKRLIVVLERSSLEAVKVVGYDVRSP